MYPTLHEPASDGPSESECTKIAHRRSLAIFTADEGIAGNSAARTIFTHFIRRRNRGSLAIFFAEEIAHLGASKNRAIFWGAVKIAAAAAENRAILVHSGLNTKFERKKERARQSLCKPLKCLDSLEDKNKK